MSIEIKSILPKSVTGGIQIGKLPELGKVQKIYIHPNTTKGEPGEDGFSPTVALTPIEGGYRLTITDKDGEHSADILNGEDGERGVPGLNGTNGKDGEKGNDGFSPVIEITETGEGYDVAVITATETQTFTLKNGKDGKDGLNGTNGTNGVDGVSPTITLVPITGGTQVIFTDKEGSHSFNVMNGTNGINGSNGQDGKDGANGNDGEDGFSPTISISPTANGHSVTITNKNGVNTFLVENGKDGTNGKDGVNGSDGEDGKDGVGILSVAKTATNGLTDTYTVTLTNGNTTTFTVTNGKNGTDGKDGEDGTPGKDGTDGINGTNGQDGFSSVQLVTTVRNFTETQWENYGTPGHKEIWVNVENQADLKLGDIGFLYGKNSTTACDVLLVGKVTGKSTSNNGIEMETIALIKGGQGPAGSIGPAGPTGAAGHTPVKGTDYYTEADKAEMVQLVLAALPNLDEMEF